MCFRRKNGHTRHGKQNYQGKACERQFRATADDCLMTDRSAQEDKPLLRERLSLRGICPCRRCQSHLALALYSEMLYGLSEDASLSSQSSQQPCSALASRRKPMRCGASYRRRPTGHGSGLRWMRLPPDYCLACGGSEPHEWQRALGAYADGLPKRRRSIPTNMPSTLGSFRRHNTKPSRSTPAKPIISSASIIPCGSASPASSVTRLPSRKSWRTTSVPSNISYAITT